MSCNKNPSASRHGTYGIRFPEFVTYRFIAVTSAETKRKYIVVLIMTDISVAVNI